jgi:hypothetical protein
LVVVRVTGSTTTSDEVVGFDNFDIDGPVPVAFVVVVVVPVGGDFVPLDVALDDEPFG